MRYAFGIESICRYTDCLRAILNFHIRAEAFLCTSNWLTAHIRLRQWSDFSGDCIDDCSISSAYAFNRLTRFCWSAFFVSIRAGIGRAVIRGRCIFWAFVTHPAIFRREAKSLPNVVLSINCWITSTGDSLKHHGIRRSPSVTAGFLGVRARTYLLLFFFSPES